MSPTKSSKRPLEFDSFPEPKRVCVSPSPSEDSDDDTTVSVKSAMLGSLLVKKLSDKARIPTRGSKYAAGFDLYRFVLGGRPCSPPSHAIPSAASLTPFFFDWNAIALRK